MVYGLSRAQGCTTGVISALAGGAGGVVAAQALVVQDSIPAGPTAKLSQRSTESHVLNLQRET